MVSASWCTTSDAGSDEIDETLNHMRPVVVLETLNMAR